MPRIDRNTPTQKRSLGFRARIIVLATLTACITAALVGQVGFRATGTSLRDSARNLLASETRLNAERVAAQVQRLQSEAAILSRLPAVQSLLAGPTTEDAQLETWLEELFTSFLEGQKQYTQVRLIAGGALGQELVRVDNTDDGPRVAERAASGQGHGTLPATDHSSGSHAGIFL